LTCILGVGQTAAISSVKIGRPVVTGPGEYVVVDIAFDNPEGIAIGGFDLYLAYDSALSLQTVTSGQLLVDCGWEYFTYQPTGQNELRIVAMADIINGGAHPSCYAESSGNLVRMVFRADCDPMIDMDFLTIRYLWYDCGDNTLSSVGGDTLFISSEVYAFNGVYEYPIAQDTTFPTPYGAPDGCLPNYRGVDFYNGGVSAILNDTEPPTAICPEQVITETDSGQCGAFVDFSPAVTDNSPDATISCYPSSGSFFMKGHNAVTCVAVDIGGNSDTCGFLVTVNDTEPPQLECPPDTTVFNDSGQCSAGVFYDYYVVDNCPGVSVSCSMPSSSYFSVGTTPVTCIAVDPAGNADTASFNITVIDSQPPMIGCPDDLILPNDSNQCGANINFDVTAADNCLVESITCDPPSGSFFHQGPATVTCIALDVFGHADTGNFNVTIFDTEPPVAICPDNITIANDPGVCGASVSFVADVIDNCISSTITCDPPSGSFFANGTGSVACIAIDAAGNADTNGFTITVVDTQAPYIGAPSEIEVANDSGLCGAFVAFDPLIADNCPGVTLSCFPSSGTFFPIGFTTVACVGTDAYGNADTVAFPVIVSDTAHPVINCPADIEVPNDSGAYGAIVTFSPTATDNCRAITINTSPPSGSLFDMGTTTVEVIATDEVGNASICYFEVTVVLNDPDNDGIASWDDNCPEIFNPQQEDSDGDGIGNICDWLIGDANGDNQINVGDAVFVIGYVFNGAPAPDPVESGDANCDGWTNVADAVFLINYIFGHGPEPDCGI
jgi:hypothetical protein